MIDLQTPDWLAAMHEQAALQFTDTGLPSNCLEEWRYTNVSALQKKQFALAGTAATIIDSKALKDRQLADCYCLVIVDGVVNRQASLLQDLPESITICSLIEAQRTHADCLQKHLGKAIATEKNGFLDFNSAYFVDGAFVFIPEGQILPKPLQIIHLMTQSATAASRHLVVLEENSKADIIESFISLEEFSYLTNSVLEAFVADNAELTLYKLQAEVEQAFHFGGVYCLQASFARLTQHAFSFGSALARSEVHSRLETAAECTLNGLFLGAGRQHTDNHTRIIHAKPYGISREFYKGIINDRARGVFQGRVIVAEQAQKTDSQMSNRNLLLSDNAEVDTKPQLEIYADDVKCSHGVTVGQLDEKAVFYLQSRGVDVATARNMLVFAFANEMVERVKIKSLREMLLEQLLQHFPQQDVDKEWL